MSFTEEQSKKCQAPLNAAHIRTRSQSGRSLSYVEGHQVIRELNDVFGFDAWSRKKISCDLVQCEQKESNGRDLWFVGYVYTAELKVNGVTREGTGFGQGQDCDLGRAHESAIKEAETDALKRASVTFGDRFGLALYDKAQTHVDTSGVEGAAPLQKDRHQGGAGGNAQRQGSGTDSVVRQLQTRPQPTSIKGWASFARDNVNPDDRRLIESLSKTAGLKLTDLAARAQMQGLTNSKAVLDLANTLVPAGAAA